MSHDSEFEMNLEQFFAHLAGATTNTRKHAKKATTSSTTAASTCPATTQTAAPSYLDTPPNHLDALKRQ